MEDRLINVDFNEIFYAFKKRFWIIIIIPILATALAIKKVSTLQPSYSATAKVFMGNSQDMLSIYSESELSYYSQFITIFSEISKIDGFLDDTLKKHKIEKTIPVPVLGSIPVLEKEFRKENKNVCNKGETEISVS